MGVHTTIYLYEKKVLKELLTKDQLECSSEAVIAGIKYCYFATSDNGVYHPNGDEVWAVLFDVPCIELNVMH